MVVCIYYSLTSVVDIFCDEDGNREFGRHKVCPACRAILTSFPGLLTPALVACSTNFGTASDKRWVRRPGYKANSFHGNLAVLVGYIVTFYR